MSGGTIAGTAIGVTTGETNIAHVSGTTTTPPSQLEQAQARVQLAADQARQRGDDDLADDLASVLHSLQAAARAQHEGKAERQAAKLREAAEALGSAAAGQPELGELAEALRRLRT
jgi:hypothetical protein